MTTAVPSLHPLRLGQLLDYAVSLYRKNFLRFIGIVALVQVPLAFLGLLITLPGYLPLLADGENFSFTPSNAAGLLGGSAATTVLNLIFIQGVATVAMTRAVADSYLGEPAGILDTYRKIGKAWWQLLVALLLALVVDIGLAIWLIIPCIGWTTGLGMLLFFGWIVTPLIAPVIVLERQLGGQAVRRAWDLARRRFWWLMALAIVLVIFGQLIISGPTILITALYEVIAGNSLEGVSSGGPLILRTIVQSLLSLLTSLFYYPLQITVMTLVYFDLRVRTEGFDLAWRAEKGLATPPPLVEILKQAPPPETSSLITSREMGYFFLVSLAGVVGLGLLYFILALMLIGLMGAAGGFP